MILGSVGPTTVIQYLNFAIGIPIQSPVEHEPKAAVGLEMLAREIRESPSYAPSTRSSSIKHSRGVDAKQEPESLSQKLEDLNIKKEDPSELLSDSSETEDDDGRSSEPFLHYGAISDKIGETAACWLARWGPDILVYEQRSTKDLPTSISSRPMSFPSQAIEDISNHVIPVVWNRGGLNHTWIRALVSSDTLFVKGERERYEFAKSVIDLRRRFGIDQKEEEEWTRMFSTGIYYAHMVRSQSSACVITLNTIISVTGRYNHVVTRCFTYYRTTLCTIICFTSSPLESSPSTSSNYS